MILIIDDNADIRSTLQDTLEVEGYESVTACDGQEGLDLIARGLRPTLIILDLMMPRMNGWRFLETIQETPEYSAIPVVVASAMTSKAETVSSAVFLKKPLDLEKLLGFIKNHCEPSTRQTA